MLKKLLPVILFTLLLTKLNGQTKIAVLEIKPINVKAEVSQIITESMVTHLAENPNFDVIERTQINKIFDELKLVQTEDFEDETLIEIGQLAKVKLILIGSVAQFGNQFIINIRAIDIESAQIVYARNISCKSTDELMQAVEMMMKKMQLDRMDIEENLVDYQTFSKPDFLYIDNFTSFNRELWEKISKNDEITISTQNNNLVFSGAYRKGRLNSINSITSLPFKAKDFIIEVSFRSPTWSADSFSILIGNVDWLRGNALQILVNFKKEYYQLRSANGQNWTQNDDLIIDELFGDENKVFHTLRLIWNKEKKVAYGYIDDQLIGKIDNFEFVKTDKVTISLNVSESVSSLNKDFLFEVDTFKSSINLIK